MCLNELTRLNSHLVWLGTHAMDIGALTVFLYCFREREDILRLFEHVAGQRMMTSYFRVGGLALEPPLDFFDRVRAFIKRMPEKIDEYENLLTGNPIFFNRLKGVGHLSAEDAIALGVTGPPLRASGVDWDLRRDMPYSSYEKFQFQVPVSNDCDVWARYVVRIQEMRESVKIVERLAGMPEAASRRCAARRPAGPREDEDPDGVAHLPLKIVTEGHRSWDSVSGGRITARQMGYFAVAMGRQTIPRAYVEFRLQRRRRCKQCAKGG